jgi:hypothetical protein
MKRNLWNGMALVWECGSRQVKLVVGQDTLEIHNLTVKRPNHLAAAEKFEEIESRLMEVAGALA